ncbi:hypothetical protein C4B63_13g275 [Trypanosoma cruzi]|uniref:Uncharacterized protein n=1 Tax=Trypanosoma cruzi TaxID=5693 RepID=A0A2V2VRK1_TRYCR|nr:hypothetical protein C4B63_13g275 [Trypanosoma cruzi]
MQRLREGFTVDVVCLNSCVHAELSSLSLSLCVCVCVCVVDPFFLPTALRREEQKKRHERSSVKRCEKGAPIYFVVVVVVVVMRPSSYRRPKSSAASDVGRRIRYSDAPPWDRSIRVNGDRALSAGRAARRGPEMMKTKLQGTPARPSHCNLVTTQAATLVATVPPVNEPQVELMSQLQDVVVRLSQSAVGEKQRLAHMQQRLDAYAALMREQDRMIDELRGMNIRLQKERDALILFRQQSLNHDLHLMNNLENDGGIDEEARRAYAKYEGQKNSYGTPYNGSLGAMTPRSRGFVRSLVAQLRDERRKRLEVEEQSSRMIGEQQLTIQRLEDRLRPQVVAPRSVLVARLESPHVSSHQRASNEEKDAVDTPLQCLASIL